MFGEPDRATSTAVSYTILIVLSVTLTTGLVLGTNSLVGDQRERVVHEQLEVVGERLAATLTTADRLAATDSNPDTLAITRQFPNRVAGSQYRLKISSSGSRSSIVLESRGDNEVTASVSVKFQSVSGLREKTINGGHLTVEYDTSSDELVITNV